MIADLLGDAVERAAASVSAEPAADSGRSRRPISPARVLLNPARGRSDEVLHRRARHARVPLRHRSYAVRRSTELPM